MAQGSAIKKPSAPSAAAQGNKGARRNKPQQPKKGARVAKSKKGGAATQSADNLRRKLNAGLAARTEKLLGERAGHLEMLRGGKKDKDGGKKKQGAAAASDDKKTTQKGGSRKFG